MASRVTKTGNTKEFAQATQPWHIADLDTDLDNLYNAGVDTTNIATNAGIVGTQLATGTISPTQLAADAVITAKILNNNVTLAKLAVGGTVAAVVSASPGALLITTSELPIVTLPSFTARGTSKVLIGGLLATSLSLVGLSGTQVTVTLKLYVNRGGAGFTALNTWLYLFKETAAAESIGPVPTPFYVDTATAATQVYELRGQTDNGAATIINTATGRGTLFAVEVA